MIQTAIYNEERFRGLGGLNIFMRSWRPAEKARAAVVIVHGFNSHSGQYLWVADEFVSHGLSVYALDHRGRGQSDGDRYYVEAVSDYVSDVHTLVRIVKEREPGLPVFMLGHSAGGVISCIYALEHQAELAGLICESFAYQVPGPEFVLAVIKGISRIAPHANVLRERNADFSRDPQVVESMNNDPLIANEVQPTQTVAAMVRADERLKTDFPLITLPLFILHGTEDHVTKFQGSQFFYETAGSPDKTLKLYDGYYHDPLNDVGKERVMADIRDWIDAHLT